MAEQADTSMAGELHCEMSSSSELRQNMRVTIDSIRSSSLQTDCDSNTLSNLCVVHGQKGTSTSSVLSTFPARSADHPSPSLRVSRAHHCSQINPPHLWMWMLDMSMTWLPMMDAFL